MLFKTPICKQRSYEEIMQKHNLAGAAVHKAKQKLLRLYSEDCSAEEARLTQEAFEKNETYLKALDFVAKAFRENTGGHPEEVSEEVLKEIFKAIQAVYDDNIHELHSATQHDPVNSNTYIRSKRWKAQALGWVLGISPEATESDANYFHNDRIFGAINNLYKNARFYAPKHEKGLTSELSDDFNLLIDFAYATFLCR